MKVPKVRFPAVAAAAVGLGALFAFVLPAGAAVSVQSQSPPVKSVSLGRTATLDANGAVIFAPVKLVCPVGSDAFLTVTVTENVGNAIAKGSASQQIEPCTGVPQSFRMAVTPDQKPFKKGVAFGQAFFTVCPNPPFERCRTLIDQHNVKIVKK
jgi:hypothetical protein